MKDRKLKQALSGVGISGREGKQRENMVDALSICE
jgi:hypothetical protein